MTYEEIKKDKEILTYIQQADECLGALGYTEHSLAHVTHCAKTAGKLLTDLGYDEHTVQLAQIAGHLHDIGNMVNREAHAQSGAILAFSLLRARGMDPADVAEVVTAIGNHDEGTAQPVSPQSAALILADKSDVRRSRVRRDRKHAFDIHDRVNYAVTGSSLNLSEDKKNLTLSLTLDTAITDVMSYFEIFLSRMSLCKKAAKYLGLRFQLEINGQKLVQ